MNRIENLLRETMGLHAATIGSALIERAAVARMRSHGLTKPADYLALLKQSPAEWNTLMESLVVTETWFFRDREPFRALAGLIQSEWLPSHPTGGLRLLSVPCSTGEEPYSISMALLDAGLPASRFQIDAVDISQTAIARAQGGEYGKNSFRGKEIGFRARHFQAKDKGYSLNAPVRQPVRFKAGNLLDDNCLPETGKYDFIFCRNLLIYFDRPTQQKALRKLHRLLTEPGILFLGSAEVLIAARNGFVPANLPFSFACRKAQAEGNITNQRARPAKAKSQAKSSPEAIQPPQGPCSHFPALHSELLLNAPVALQPSSNLDTARQLANAGRLAEAAEICETHLREHGVSAEAYYLLGLARDAAGAISQAGEFYRKALYLEPNHYETLQQWASLAKKNGDGEHARILNERAERLRKTGLKNR